MIRISAHCLDSFFRFIASVLTLFSLTLSSSTYAADSDAQKETAKKEALAKVKSMAIANIESRIKALESTKSCISGASNKDEMKSCREQAKSQMKELRKSTKSQRQELKSQLKAAKRERMAKRKKKSESDED